MKVFITKYALTKGIIEVDGEISSSTPEIVSYKNDGDGGISNSVHGKSREWHLSKDKAMERAEEMRLKKIHSLKKKIKKLEALMF